MGKYCCQKLAKTLSDAGYEVISIVEFRGAVKEDTRESLRDAVKKLIGKLKT